MSEGKKTGTGYQYKCDRCKRRLVGYNDSEGVSGLELRIDPKTKQNRPYFRPGEQEVCVACLHADKDWNAAMMKNCETTRNPNVRP